MNNTERIQELEEGQRQMEAEKAALEQQLSDERAKGLTGTARDWCKETFLTRQIAEHETALEWNAGTIAWLKEHPEPPAAPDPDRLRRQGRANANAIAEHLNRPRLAYNDVWNCATWAQRLADQMTTLKLAFEEQQGWAG